MSEMGLGPLMVDIEGPVLTEDEAQMLRHSLVGGVVLFARNFTSVPRLTALIDAIHELRSPALVVAVDHEGGRVQRFRDGFTPMPPPGVLGEVFERDPGAGVHAANLFGQVIGSELAAVGVDVNFAPVVDLGGRNERIIGRRALHRDPTVVGMLAGAMLGGMEAHGVGGVAKHYPGHGGADGDTHVQAVCDSRSLEQWYQDDYPVYCALVGRGLTSVMTAHVTFTNIDDMPATFSSRWQRDMLRGELGFVGTVFSDDLSMHAALGADGLCDRFSAALAAGCDVVLACNNRVGVSVLLKQFLDAGDSVKPNAILRSKVVPSASRIEGKLALASLRRMLPTAVWQEDSA
jgi:beta-N-acetylhexosaminidase